ncbi:bacterial Ig-like domain-containing protein [Lactiplantibacillus argentoratensis]|uniref:bacterial Ig-like domain-containing protein n=1 Tax=Lactiplantibacillus argentoratensis TaxID=271881 RepID=UPI001CE1992C|nr:bacterial Ig-like domain-containing protein [Lactiplantibacillus argentoratensis]MCA5598199.1 bacterial Ig-like domain-containing protein [Lactiplantibacillus argentoratensis]
MNRFIMSKQHYKMYKKGRFWVFAGITVASFTLNPLLGRADTETATTAATTTAEASSSSNSQVLRTTTTSTTGATTQSSATATNAATTNTSAQKKQAVSGTTTDSKTDQPVTAVGENENATSNLSTSDSASASSQAKTGSGDSLDQTSNSSVSVASSSQKVTTQNSDYQNDQGTGSESGIQSNVTDMVEADESLQTNRSSVASPSTSTMASIGDSDLKDSNETEKVVDSETSPIAVTATTNTITTTNDKVQLNRALLARAATPAIVQSGTLGTSQWTMNSDGIVTIGAGDWSNVDDVSGLFYTLGSTVTGVVIDGKVNAGEDLSYLFFKSPNLATITGFQNIDTSKVTNFSNMFHGTSIADFSSISNWNVSASENFYGMFSTNSKVQSIDLSHWKLNQAQSIDMRQMFSADTALTSIDLSAWNMSMVDNINGMFAGNDLNTMALKSVDLHGWNLKNVTDMGTMFNFDNSLTSVNMSGWQTSSNLSSVKTMFRGTSSLASLDLSSIDLQGATRKDMLLSQNELYDPIPSSLSTLTLGTMSVLTDTGLPDIPTGTGYTGKWVNQADATQTYTSSELMALYNGVDNPADTITWVWETSPSYADFTSKNVTGLIAGPKTTWRVADSVATLKDVNGTDIYATADTVVKVISVNGDTAVTTVDTQTAGTYQVDLQYTDAYGKVWQQTSTVAVAVNQGKLVGKPLTIKMGAKPTYTMSDLIDTDNSHNAAGDKLSADELATATVSGLDTSKAGAQTVTLAYTDDATGMVHTTTTTVTMVATKADLTMRNSTIIKGPKNSSWDYRQYVTSVTDFDGDPVSLDGLNIVVDQQPDLTQIGSQTVTLTYTDALGNVISVPTQVTVVASQAQVTAKAPLTVWPSEAAQLKVADLVTITAANGNPVDTSTDLTDVTMSSIDTSKGGAQTVTITYTDEAGNLVTAYAKVTVDQSDLKTKLTKPIAGPKAKWDYLAGLEWVKDANGKLLDNLATADIKVVTEPDLSVAMVGHDQTVTLSYTDELGKEHLVTAVVNTVASKAKITAVSDQIIIPDDTKKLTATDLVSELIDAAGNKATNFGDVTMSGFDAKAIGPQTVTLTYTDAYGNQTTDSTTVTVDFATIAGQATYPIAGPTATWDYRDSVTQVIDANGKTIDVNTADITATTPDLTPAKAGKPQTVTLTYTDSLGKVHTTAVIVTTTLSKAKITAVVDQVIWPDQAKQLTATDLVDRLYDAEGHLITNYDNVKMSLLDSKLAGQQRLTLTYTDVAGNQSVAYANVTVDQAKLVTKPSTVIAGPTATWRYEAGISQLTNAAGQLITVQPGTIKVLNRPDLSVDSVGQQQLITLIYTDELGKSQSATAMVTAVASQATLTAKKAVIVQPDAAAKLTANDLVTRLTDASGQAVTDYQIVQMSKLDATRPGVQPVSLTYTDAAGNEVSAVVKVTVDQAKIESQNRTQIWGPSMTWDYRQQLATVTDSQGHQLNPDQAKITVITGPQLTAKMIDKPQTVTLMYTDDLQQTHTVSATLTLTASQAALVPRPAQIVWAKDAGQLTPANFLQTITGADGTQVSSLTNVKMSAVNASQSGVQTVTLTYTDDYGNEVTTNAQVTVDQAALTTQTARPVAGPTAQWDYRANFKTVTNAAGEVLNVSDANIKVLTGPDLSTAMVGRPQVVTFSYTDELGLTQTASAKVTTVASQAHMTTRADQVIWPATVGKLTVADLITGLTDAWGQTSQNYQNVTMTAINAQQAGKQQVTLTYTDAVGNVKTATTTVTVDQAALTTQPQTVIAGPTAKWDYHQGIGTITDGMGQPIAVNNAAITVVAMPDLTVAHVGQPQTVQLVYTDSLGQQQTALVQVTTVATQAKISTRPVTVIAGPKTTWSLNDSVDWSTSLAADGTSLTAAQRQRVTVDGHLNLQQAGNYPLTLSYMDRAGNLITVMTSINVLASQAQLQVRDSQLTVGNTWTAQDNFERATDAQGQVLTLADIAVDGTVDTQRAGQYTLTYRYTDVAGNQLTKTAVVTVVLPDDDHINTTDPGNNDHGETPSPDGNDHAGNTDPNETPKPSERPNDSDGQTVDLGVGDQLTTKQQPAAATQPQTKVKTGTQSAAPALPAQNERTSAAKAAATPVTRVTDTVADTLPQTDERSQSAQQGAVLLGLSGLFGLIGLGRRRHRHED